MLNADEAEVDVRLLMHTLIQSFTIILLNAKVCDPTKRQETPKNKESVVAQREIL